MVKKIFKFAVLLLIIISMSSGGSLFYVSQKMKLSNLGIIETPSAKYVGIKAENIKMKDYASFSSEAFKKLAVLHDANPNVVFGPAFAIYEKSKNDDEDKYDMTVAIEIIDGNVTADNDFIFGTRPSIKANVFKATGEYKYLSYAWLYSIFKTKMSKEYKIDEKGISFETYTVSVVHDVAPSEYETDIYIPVVAKH